MRTFDIRRVRSGVEEDYAWVTLWYRGDGQTLEALHFVCSREAQGGRHAKFDTLYLERHDQAVACYAGAERVTVGESGIKVTLNRSGVKSLGLDASFAVAASGELTGWAKARRVFREMAGYPTGAVLELSE